MCGIAGICALSESGAVSLDLVKRMTASLRHRGPDEAGVYIDAHIALGHARLKIIDLKSGIQPIHNENESLWISYNGEVFNYPELREELLARGHAFYTTSDTEVLLHAYEEYGPAFLDRLNGQFALAIWDSTKRELFLARDRLGIRPLYYTTVGDTLLFASEIKAILQSPDVRASLDPVALDQVFTLWAPLGHRTAFAGIRELLPGHAMRVRNGSCTATRYAPLPFVPDGEQTQRPFADLRDEAAELLKDAVRIRLRADVPVGAYVSGGLDSSGVAALAKRFFKPDLRTFGIRFEDDVYDEGQYQKSVVAALETEHSEILATGEAVGSTFADVVRHAEKPMLRTAPAPLFLLSRRVRDSGMKVVLTGEGADEVFGGYNIFREAKVRAFWARNPSSKWRSSLLRKLYPYVFNSPAARMGLESFFGFTEQDVADPLFSHLVRWRNTSRTKMFFSAELKHTLEGYSALSEVRESLPPEYGGWDLLCRAQYLEMTVFLSNYLLSSQGDRMAMAHGVEIRLPYLDPRLLTFMGGAPAKWKIRGLNEKYLLKRALAGQLPPEVAQRPKHPYRAPIANALLGGQSREYALDMLSESSVRDAGLFDAGKVQKLIARMDGAGARNEVAGMALAGILSTQVLHRQFVSKEATGRTGDHDVDMVVDRTGTAR
jgi:asparagine synthase (glutamine-hydrolysing)